MTLTDAALATELAEAAGRILLDLRASGGLAGKALGEAGDRLANRYLMDRLAAERPDDGVLSEESRDTLERLFKSRVWIVDPLDGTREYGEERPDWAVHVGLAVDGVAQVGAVALPGLGLVLRERSGRVEGDGGGPAQQGGANETGGAGRKIAHRGLHLPSARPGLR